MSDETGDEASPLVSCAGAFVRCIAFAMHVHHCENVP
jgi:hypothetical protein